MNRSLTTYRPNRLPSALPSLFSAGPRDFDRLFDTLWAAPTGRPAAASRPRVDVAEAADAWRVTAELPGFAEDQVEITVSDGVLSLKAEAVSPKEDEAVEGEAREAPRYHIRERTAGELTRRFRLPEDVDAAAITARFEHGVLTVTLPKVPPVTPEVHRIEIATD